LCRIGRVPKLAPLGGRQNKQNDCEKYEKPLKTE
jgi:hypothetical protein